MKSGCVSDSTRAAGRRLAEAHQTALANFGSQARRPSPCGVHPKTETEKIGKMGTRVPVPTAPAPLRNPPRLPPSKCANVYAGIFNIPVHCTHLAESHFAIEI